MDLSNQQNYTLPRGVEHLTGAHTISRLRVDGAGLAFDYAALNVGASCADTRVVETEVGVTGGYWSPASICQFNH